VLFRCLVHLSWLVFRSHDAALPALRAVMVRFISIKRCLCHPIHTVFHLETIIVIPPQTDRIPVHIICCTVQAHASSSSSGVTDFALYTDIPQVHELKKSKPLISFVPIVDDMNCLRTFPDLSWLTTPHYWRRI